MNAVYFAVLTADECLRCAESINGALCKFEIDAVMLPTDGAAEPATIVGYPIITGPSTYCPQ